jgi:pimeloyl-ACP methyl ester carboxylesterase
MYIRLLIVCFVGLLKAHEVTVIPAKIDHYGTIDEVHKDLIDDEGGIMEKVTLFAQKKRDSQETIARKGLLYRHKNARANILMCHGFMCNKFDVGFVRSLFGNDYNFLAFDFRAHGELAEDQVCTFGRDEIYDVVAGAQFMRHHPEIAHLPLLVYGFSMGAVSAIEAQARYPYLFKGMLLDCPFDSVDKVLKRSLNNITLSFCGYQCYMPGRQLLHKYAFHPYVQAMLKPMLKVAACLDRRQVETHICQVKPEETVQKIVVPCLFICCKNDEKVSVDAITAVYNGAQGFKRLYLTHGRSHCDSFVYNPECYGKNLKRFVRAVLDGSIQCKRQEKIIEEAVDVGCGGAII